MTILVQKGSVLEKAAVKVKDVSWLVVFDNDEQPIAVVEQIGRDTVYVVTCSDERFLDMLKRLGINKKVAVSEVSSG